MGQTFDGLVKTSIVPTHVHMVGDGPPLLMVHGGPGFDHRYLESAFWEVGTRRKLIFYDQPGCGRTASPNAGLSASVTIDHLCALHEELFHEEPVDVVAHSWGAFLCVAAAKRASHRLFSKALVVTPVPLSAEGYDECRRDFASRLPSAAQRRLSALVASKADGETIMKLLLPFYHGPAPHQVVPDLHFNFRTYTVVTDSLGVFDLRGCTDVLGSLTLVLGALDFTTPTLVPELVHSAVAVHRIPDVCHFPFYEAPDRFWPILDTWLRLCEH